MHPRSSLLLDRNRSLLLIIDVQERLLPTIADHQRIVWNIGRLIDGAQLFGVPFSATEQYPKGLGATVEIIRQRLESIPEKSMFSCRECTSLFSSLLDTKIRQIVLTGIETHVCVQQTAFDLSAMGFDVYLVVDAVGSRFEIDRQTAVDRMRIAGVTPVTTEAVMFEWCETSADSNFKALSQLVRQTAPQH